ncbi:MAG: VanW family protein [Patescibacteria group bacterium]|jgi:vancomycin resistance protein YoaR
MKRNFLHHVRKQAKKVRGPDGWFALGLLVLLVAVLVAVPKLYAKTIVPGVWIGNMPVGGKTVAEATELLNVRMDVLYDKGVKVTIDGKTTNLATQQAITASDVAPPLVDVNVEASVDGAFAYGRNFGVVRSTLQAWRAMLFRKHVDPAMEADPTYIADALHKQYGAKDNPAQDAHLQYVGGTFQTKPEQAGKALQYEPAAIEVVRVWKALAEPAVTLVEGEDVAKVKVADVEKFFDDAQEIVDRAPVTLQVPDGEAVTLNAAAVAGGLDVIPGTKRGSFTLAFTEAKLQKTLDSIRAKTDVEAQDARFQISGGKVTEFAAGKIGKQLDDAATVAALNTQVIGKDASVAVAVVTTVQPQSAADSAAELGITELVATGKTNFAGSPTNRRKNIANAVRLLNGLLIQSGEEFSLVKALSPIELSNGYFPELVIKGNRTIPEVGGGLCQVGTTMFRLILNSGLPVLERRNHSYRVSYYEPPVGMDATIYDPSPDFRFTNDYATALLLQTRVVKDDLIFDFYGTKDGRVAHSSTPKLFNVTKPPAVKYIKTTDMAVGQKKRLERAHNGGSAEFTYTVTKDGKTTTKVFTSKYRAWQEVWLVGATAEEVAAEQAA